MPRLGSDDGLPFSFELVTVSSKRVRDSRIAQAGCPAKGYTCGFVISVADKKIAAGQRGVKLQAVQNTPLVCTQGINVLVLVKRSSTVVLLSADASRRCSFRSISVPAVSSTIWLISSERIVPFLMFALVTVSSKRVRTPVLLSWLPR